MSVVLKYCVRDRGVHCGWLREIVVEALQTRGFYDIHAHNPYVHTYTVSATGCLEDHIYIYIYTHTYMRQVQANPTKTKKHLAQSHCPSCQSFSAAAIAHQTHQKKELLSEMPQMLQTVHMDWTDGLKRSQCVYIYIIYNINIYLYTNRFYANIISFRCRLQAYLCEIPHGISWKSMLPERSASLSWFRLQTNQIHEIMGRQTDPRNCKKIWEMVDQTGDNPFA